MFVVCWSEYDIPVLIHPEFQKSLRETDEFRFAALPPATKVFFEVQQEAKRVAATNVELIE